MKKILLFGSTGNLGKSIALELKQQGYDLTVVVRNKNKADQLSAITKDFIIADVTNKTSLINICNGFDVVISALGKSVSVKDKSKPTFNDIDLIANSFVLDEAIKAGVKKFIYVSALHSEKYLHLEYFRVHHEFSEKLKNSGLNYSIIKPPAIFCGFVDLIEMSKKGRLINIGKGDKKTNPIYEGDLAKICVDAIKTNNTVIEAGGKNIYSRKEINEIIQNEINPGKAVRTVPLGLIKLSLPFMRIFDQNGFNKFAFFIEVMQHDTIAPQIGEMKFENYIKTKMIQ
jgi:uncharacterized protein YbjT (DUF2867 family)